MKTIRSKYETLLKLGQSALLDTSLVKRDSTKYLFKRLKASAISAYGEMAINLFEEEARYFQDLGEHSQIMALVERGEDSLGRYMVHEYVSGEDLDQLLGWQGIFTALVPLHVAL